MGAMFGNLDHTAELEAPSVRAGRFTQSRGVEVFRYSPSRCKIRTTEYITPMATQTTNARFFDTPSQRHTALVFVVQWFCGVMSSRHGISFR